MVLVHPRGDVSDERRWWGLPPRQDLRTADDGHPSCAHDAHHLRREREQAFEDVRVGGAFAHRASEILVDRATGVALGETVTVLERGDLERGQAGQKLTRHPRLLRNAVRSAVARTSDEAPQPLA